MKKFSKIKSILELGGINLLLFKIEDKILGGRSGYEYLYKIYENAEPEDYPRMLKIAYNIAMGGIKFRKSL